MRIAVTCRDWSKAVEEFAGVPCIVETIISPVFVPRTGDVLHMEGYTVTETDTPGEAWWVDGKYQVVRVEAFYSDPDIDDPDGPWLFVEVEAENPEEAAIYHRAAREGET